jgi:hypothetical protein
MTGCETLHSADWCGIPFNLARSAGFDNIIVKCDRKIGLGFGADGFEDHVYPNFLAEWAGEPAFKPAAYTDGGHSVQCLPLESRGPATEATVAPTGPTVAPTPTPTTIRAVPRSGGSCQPYNGPADGMCGFLSGRSVFKFYGTDSFPAMQDSFHEHTEFTFMGLSSVASAKCINHFLPFLCSTWFPECDGNGKPRLNCMTGCEMLQSADWCGSAFYTARLTGMEKTIVKCDRKIGHGSGADGFDDHVYPNFLAEWAGEPAFKLPTYTDGGQSVQCLPLKLAKESSVLSFGLNLNPTTSLASLAMLASLA